MKKHSNRQFARALYEITEDLPKKDLPEAVAQFAAVLQKHNKLKKADFIIEEFINYSKKQAGIKTIVIESAFAVEHAAINKIKKVFGENSDITETINKNLLGGIRVKVDDMIYDASLKKQLSRLKNQLI